MMKLRVPGTVYSGLPLMLQGLEMHQGPLKSSHRLEGCLGPKWGADPLQCLTQ